VVYLLITNCLIEYCEVVLTLVDCLKHETTWHLLKFISNLNQSGNNMSSKLNDHNDCKLSFEPLIDNQNENVINIGSDIEPINERNKVDINNINTIN